MLLSRRIASALSLCVLFAVAACSGGSQSMPPTAAIQSAPAVPQTGPAKTTNIDIGTPNASDEAAARGATILYHHVYGRAVNSSGQSVRTQSFAQFGPLVYWGGPVLSNVVNNPVFVNCKNPIACYGNVELFLTQLQHSNMIHIVDQYMEPNPITANNRYQAGNAMSTQYPISGPLPYTSSSGPNALAIVHHAAVIGGAGFGHIYHILFPPGVEICDLPGDCEPDHYCADHGAVMFPDIGIVLTNLEAYQGDTCASQHYGNIPHTLIDATANAMSHEIFESITDPYAQLSFQTQYGPYAWLDSSQNFEIGDLCEDDGLEAPVNLAGKTYTIQPEYSNKVAGCTYTP